jgi:hypothetical protein
MALAGVGGQGHASAGLLPPTRERSHGTHYGKICVGPKGSLEILNLGKFL